MCVYLRTKFQVSSIILKSSRQEEVILPPPPPPSINKPLKNSRRLGLTGFFNTRLDNFSSLFCFRHPIPKRICSHIINKCVNAAMQLIMERVKYIRLVKI